MKMLAIESSCDETAAAVVEDGVKILSNVVASSTTMHRKYGGIVPEVAAREQLKSIVPTIIEALQPLSSSSPITDYQLLITKSIDAIAVSSGPGLIGSLLVGVETAKTLAFATGKPLIPVNHVLAHMYANFIKTQIPDQSLSSTRSRIGDDNKIEFPAISLVVSGGHTELFLMKNEKDLQWLGGTMDDAAGEAFDKTARLLGFENRGGVAIQEAASKPQGIRASMVKLPRPMMHDKTLNFSFSGLKTAILREWKKDAHPTEETIHTFAYEVQEAITDVLVYKTINAAKTYGAKSILLSGGVAANLRLREKFMNQSSRFKIHVPPINLCTDNAVYIASYAYFRGIKTDWHEVTATPDLTVEI